MCCWFGHVVGLGIVGLGVVGLGMLLVWVSSVLVFRFLVCYRVTLWVSVVGLHVGCVGGVAVPCLDQQSEGNVHKDGRTVCLFWWPESVFCGWPDSVS